MSNELQLFQRYGLSELKGIAEVFAKSGYFRDAREASQAFVKILAGQELGIPPMQAMTGYHIVEGKPVASATLIGTLIKRSARYNYRVVEHSDEVCAIIFLEGEDEIGVSRFTIADAKVAGLMRPGSGWTKYPKNMLFARALSNGAKWYTPDVFGGPIYTPDELGAEITEEGDMVIEAAPEPSPLAHENQVPDIHVAELPVELDSSQHAADVADHFGDDGLTADERGAAPSSEPGTSEEAEGASVASSIDAPPGSETPARGRPVQPKCETCGHVRSTHTQGGEECRAKNCDCSGWKEETVIVEEPVGADTDETPPASDGDGSSSVFQIPPSVLAHGTTTLQETADVIARLQAKEWLTQAQLNHALMSEFGTTELAQLQRPELSDLRDRLLRFETNRTQQEALAGLEPETL